MTYYTNALPRPAPSWCAVCGQPSRGLWCDVCLEPLQERGALWQRQPGSNIITVRRAPREENGA